MSNEPAISLQKFEKTAPGLVDLYKQAGVSLEKNRLAGQRAAVYLVLDRSGSMKRFYSDGSVPRLAEQVLGLSAHLDDDGKVPIVFFDRKAHRPVEIELTNYQGRVDGIHRKLGTMWSTNYAAAMKEVISHYLSSGATDPALVVFQTDGSPDSEAEAEQILCESANLPIHWVFVGFGNDEFRFLKKLDNLKVPEKRVIDNATFFEAGTDPQAMPDGELYDNLLAEFGQWRADARYHGIIR